jgi:hypothetical protein
VMAVAAVPVLTENISGSGSGGRGDGSFGVIESTTRAAAIEMPSHFRCGLHSASPVAVTEPFGT